MIYGPLSNLYASFKRRIDSRSRLAIRALFFVDADAGSPPLQHKLRGTLQICECDVSKGLLLTLQILDATGARLTVFVAVSMRRLTVVSVWAYICVSHWLSTHVRWRTSRTLMQLQF